MPEPQPQNALRLPTWGSDLRDNVNRMRDAADKSQLEQQQRELRERMLGPPGIRRLVEALGDEGEAARGKWKTIPQERRRGGGPAFEWVEPPRLPAWGGASSIAPPEGYEGAGIPIEELPHDQMQRRLEAHRKQMEQQGHRGEGPFPNENIIRKSRETLRKPSFQNLMREMNNPPESR